jgi:hypothetical protein
MDEEGDRRKRAELYRTLYLGARFAVVGLLWALTDGLIPKILGWGIIVLVIWAVVRIAVRTWRDWWTKA